MKKYDNREEMKQILLAGESIEKGWYKYALEVAIIHYF